METKAVYLKKRLIRDVLIGIIVLVILIGGAYEVSDYDDQTQSDKQHQDNENSKLRSEIDSIQALINNGAGVSAFYITYSKNHNSSFVLDREAVTQALAALREKNHLVNMQVTVSPVNDVAGNMAVLKTGHMIQSEIKLNFKALTDNSVYGFIQAMQRQLPGIVIVHELKISKTGEMTGVILRDLSVHKIDPMVTAEISFTWLGIRPNGIEKPTSSSPGNRPMPSQGGLPNGQ